MNELSIEELQDKIAQVVIDIEALRNTGESSKKLEILCEYKEYLEDEIRMLKREARQ
jgi:hypothetical protein